MNITAIDLCEQNGGMECAKFRLRLRLVDITGITHRGRHLENYIFGPKSA